MKHIQSLSVTVAAVLLGASFHAQAQDLILHFPMEATEEIGGKVYTNNDGSATVVEGKIGNAVKFTGEAVFAMPFRFDRKAYPRVTITAWIKQPKGPLGTRTIFNSGNKVNFVLRNGGGTLSMSADGPGVNHFRSKVPTEEWVLIAAVHNAQTGETRLHLGDSEPTREEVAVRAPGEPRLYGNPDDPNIATMPDRDKEPYIFIGGSDAVTYSGTSGELIIDEVRIYAGLLSEEQIASMRTTTIAAPLEAQAIGETEKNLINDPSRALPGDQYACRRLPGDQYTCKILPGDQYDFASLPGDQYEYARLPGDQYDPRELPGDQYACRKLPGDQYACKELPGDQYDFRALPGDQYDPRALHGDQFDPRALPGDQYACRRLPGDQYTCKILPGDQYDFASLPGDQYEYARLPGDQYEPRELPGDQYACRKLPGDQYACKELPGDQYDFRALPGDQYDPRALRGDQYDPRALPGDQY